MGRGGTAAAVATLLGVLAVLALVTPGFAGPAQLAARSLGDTAVILVVALVAVVAAARG